MTDRTATQVDADHPVKPESPTDLHRPVWRYVLRRTAREFSRDQCTDLAAGLTYYAMLSLFPALIALMSLVGLFGQGARTVDTLLGILTDVGAGSAAETMRPALVSLSGASTTAGVAFVLGLFTALWSASGYVGSFGRAMNRIYEIQEGRPFWKLRPVQLLVTLLAVVLAAAVALALVVTGPAAEAVGSAIGLGSTALLAWEIAKWPLVLLAVIVVVAILYYATPNVEQPKFRWVSVGAVLAIGVWMAASAVFGLYVANFSNYERTYGALAGVVVFLLWLWITNLALLFGAELDSELERGRELQAGMRAEETLQLPPRDVRGIEKTESKEREDYESGRELRERHRSDDDSRLAHRRDDALQARHRSDDDRHARHRDDDVLTDASDLGPESTGAAAPGRRASRHRPPETSKESVHAD